MHCSAFLAALSALAAVALAYDPPQASSRLGFARAPARLRPRARTAMLSAVDPPPAPVPPSPVAEPAVAGPAAPSDAAEAPGTVYAPQDFAGSEWKVGIVWNGREDVEVTWARVSDDGEGTVQWGFGAAGQVRVDDGAFVTLTRDFPLGWGGKRLFSARIDSDVYLEGIIRGWKPWVPADVMGQWQAYRLGVDRGGEAPPWANYDKEVVESNAKAKADAAAGLAAQNEASPAPGGAEE